MHCHEGNEKGDVFLALILDVKIILELDSRSIGIVSEDC